MSAKSLSISHTGPTRMHDRLIPQLSDASDGYPKRIAPPLQAPVPTSDLSQTAQPVGRRVGEIVCNKSNVAGKVYSNTTMFDDYEALIKGSLNSYMYELRIMHDHDFIYGVQGFYQIDGKVVAGPAHFGKEVHTGCKNESLKLQYGECIISISGNYLDVVNGLMITTSLGKTYAFGNYTSRSDTSK